MIRNYILFLAFIFFSFDSIGQDCEPKGLFLSDITSCSATLHWKSSANAKKYTVSYKLSSSEDWSPSISIGKDTVYTFTGLSADKKYDFAVRAKCSDGSGSPQKQKSGKTLACMLPDQVTIVPTNSSTVKIKVQSSCPYNKLYVRYGTLNGPSIKLNFPFADSYQVSGLDFNKTYVFEVSTCKPQLNVWTVGDTVLLPKPPNIVFILVDDCRSEYFSCDGAFPFFQTENIDRIADEGANFKNTYVATSLCLPSRAAIATGLFPLKTGMTGNGGWLDASFTTIPEVLGDHGYYTAMIGKNHHIFFNGDEPEFDYYLESVDENTYNQTLFNYNGVEKFIEHPNVETCTDTAISLIKKTQEPFFLWLAYRVSHYPNMILPSNLGKYDGVVIPWGPDTAFYDENYPSFLYDSGETPSVENEEIDSIYRDILEDIVGLDSCVGEIYDVLESTDKLDNTLLVFMSDNGFLLGSHGLNGKKLAYEPSIRVPLLARYPKWFKPGTELKSRFASNLDIAPTFFDAAGIDYSGQLDGHSIKDLYDGEFKRTSTYYLMLHNAGSSAPTTRAFRDKYFKYITYNCSSDTVAELFDMVNDPLELTNLVNNSAYNSIQQTYKTKLDSMRVVWGDTADGPLKNCFIQNPNVLKEALEGVDELPKNPIIYPTITSEYVELYMPWRKATAILYNEFGQVMGSWTITETFSRIDLPQVPSGIYYLKLFSGDRVATEKLLVSHQ